jgi:hypothetical protein
VSSTVAAAIAIAAGVVALLALVAAVMAWRTLKRVRSAQQVLLGGGKDDLVDFAVSLQARIDDLHRAVDEVAAGLARVDRRVDESLTKTSSVAVLDGARSGIVLSAIQGRDYARIYLKELEHGRASIALSPEEEEAVERAMSR